MEMWDGGSSGKDDLVDPFRKDPQEELIRHIGSMIPIHEKVAKRVEKVLKEQPPRKSFEQRLHEVGAKHKRRWYRSFLYRWFFTMCVVGIIGAIGVGVFFLGALAVLHAPWWIYPIGGFLFITALLSLEA